MAYTYLVSVGWPSALSKRGCCLRNLLKTLIQWTGRITFWVCLPVAMSIAYVVVGGITVWLIFGIIALPFITVLFPSVAFLIIDLCVFFTLYALSRNPKVKLAMAQYWGEFRRNLWEEEMQSSSFGLLFWLAVLIAIGLFFSLRMDPRLGFKAQRAQALRVQKLNESRSSAHGDERAD